MGDRVNVIGIFSKAYKEKKLQQAIETELKNNFGYSPVEGKELDDLWLNLCDITRHPGENDHDFRIRGIKSAPEYNGFLTEV